MPKGYKPIGSGRRAKEEGNPLRVTVSATISPAEWAAMEEARGDTDRSTWIRYAILEKLKQETPTA